LTNELILLTKDSSLVYLLGYTQSTIELTSFGREGPQPGEVHDPRSW
jgi:ABC-type amino acid transport system permease subunit